MRPQKCLFALITLCALLIPRTLMAATLPPVARQGVTSSSWMHLEMEGKKADGGNRGDGRDRGETTSPHFLPSLSL